jgi:hypothetical protein
MILTGICVFNRAAPGTTTGFAETYKQTDLLLAVDVLSDAAAFVLPARPRATGSEAWVEVDGYQRWSECSAPAQQA